jgi:hypothetical protein
MHVLLLLREIGLNPVSDEAQHALGLVRERVTWEGCGPQEVQHSPFFAGEVEPCINESIPIYSITSLQWATSTSTLAAFSSFR